jgi:hypothetical protein
MACNHSIIVAEPESSVKPLCEIRTLEASFLSVGVFLIFFQTVAFFCCKDSYFDEDKHHFGAAIDSVWTVLTNSAYSLGQVLRKKDKEPFCAVFEPIHIPPDKVLNWLGFKK